MSSDCTLNSVFTNIIIGTIVPTTEKTGHNNLTNISKASKFLDLKELVKSFFQYM